MGFFSRLKEGLQKTRDAMMHKMQTILNSFTKIDEELFEQLEETMIMGDMGVETSVEICERLRKLVKERGVKNPAEIMGLIEEIVSDMMGEETELDLSTKPSVIMVIGVNGAGKTTTIGKLCYQFKNDGKKVLVAAADTFRAAAIEQLEVWTERAGVSIVKHAEGSDPASVVYDAVTAAIARDCDIVIVDTAGRLQNKKNLMDELAKMNRILQQRAEGCAIETLLVLDATTGQNAVSQARLFSEVANITGIVLTKLDGTAKGGIVVSIKNELGIPVKLVGVGEKIEDLQRFNNADFVRALFDRPEEEAVSEENQQEESEAEEISKKRNSLFSFGKKEEPEPEISVEEPVQEIPVEEPEPEIPAEEPTSEISVEEKEQEISADETDQEIPVEESELEISEKKKKKSLFSFAK
ncbi:MAG: signal recognition particle-docking protein FtsY, partial [Oscillospiraceae bacterium]|nr:signal recognition particle-docking protein FtsY [Oscillospiraceae bacterium]